MLEKPFFFVTIGICQSVLLCTYGVMIIVNFIKISYFPRTFSVLLVIPTVGLSFSIIKIRAVARTLIGGGVYSYIRVMPD